ncbi:hypothetical protein LTR91_014212 [Friedmanniomyces endolithicus]|uniref:Dihydrolipoamide acetyltransferase component of pyruvate dehydrogenase complex n=1 Tax=Friedmanniomyces endolithicus TaxID=329885 RepID=A0AAN6KCA0_9PEZI|nr:hypothetical protein LTR94_011476 [Friedmanniomyces endolithicus]KAK0781137.1 hypothetical protein LTR75_014805 [Friedmanniomyces endolithicus]KAK0789761.1 hypothetical protein LTR38_010820 [Friedmanniomyces endolithicus]KAK0810667.1 hypothetical protein LTR59_002178 [Friedmanniomyces endolithicus]KAK0854576.1 hypothetical protein LTR03_002307 [Friedmanniomyces endolithicus]
MRTLLLRACRPLNLTSTSRLQTQLLHAVSLRSLHTTHHLNIVKPFLLADIGEGITECQLIQWFVQPGARVEQFDKLCEVQSDKASVEITSPFDGVIKKLHYDPDDMAITGKPLVDIDIQSEITEEDEAKLAGGGGEEGAGSAAKESIGEHEIRVEGAAGVDVAEPAAENPGSQPTHPDRRRSSGKQDHSSLATPAVRHLTKEMKVAITDVRGTGKDGRVLKEDVHRHVAQSTQQQSTVHTPMQTSARADRKMPLTPIQTQMFKLMTRSLNIPHFLYTCATDVSSLTTLRKTLNISASSPDQRLTQLPFILKAVSLAFQHHPLLNSSLDSTDPAKPQLTYRSAHSFGVAIDTPSGLLVPVIRNVQDLSINEIAAQLRQLSEKARDNKLAPSDFSGASFTISNIGNIGGGVVSPVISEPQVAILGIGRSKIVPAFNQQGELVKVEELVFSWSADHRIVDGAECARCAERVKNLLEKPGKMMVEMR